MDSTIKQTSKSLPACQYRTALHRNVPQKRSLPCHEANELGSKDLRVHLAPSAVCGASAVCSGGGSGARRGCGRNCGWSVDDASGGSAVPWRRKSVLGSGWQTVRMGRVCAGFSVRALRGALAPAIDQLAELERACLQSGRGGLEPPGPGETRAGQSSYSTSSCVQKV